MAVQDGALELGLHSPSNASPGLATACENDGRRKPCKSACTTQSYTLSAGQSAEGDVLVLLCESSTIAPHAKGHNCSHARQLIFQRLKDENMNTRSKRRECELSSHVHRCQYMVLIMRVMLHMKALDEIQRPTQTAWGALGSHATRYQEGEEMAIIAAARTDMAHALRCMQ
jgi:hypothetical protein